MRILYLHQYFVPPDGSGITRSYEFARRFIADGHEVYMITSTGMLPDRYRQQITKASEIEIEGIPCLVIPVGYSSKMSFVQRFRAFVSFALLASWHAARHRADVIFATSTPLTIAIPGIAAHLWQRKPMVFEARDLWPKLPISMGIITNPLIKAVAYALEWAAYHSAKHVVALSPGIVEGIQQRGIPADQITLVPNCCDVELFQIPASEGDEIRQKLNLKPDQPLVLYAGTFNLLNGADYLVEVAREMQAINPEVRFLLVGYGAEEALIIDKAREYNLLDRSVHIWKPVSKLDVPKIFAAATVTTTLFRPYEVMWQTNSANKFFDGLAAGKPVVVNNERDWQAQLLRESGAGLSISPTDFKQAARDLDAFLRSPERLSAASAAARDLAANRFSRDAMAKKLETVLEQAARPR